MVGDNGNRAFVHFEELDDRTFDEKLGQAQGPVVVDFWAPWCAPCRFLGEALQEIAPDLPPRLKIYKLNVDENPITASRFGIRSIPTLVFFDGSQPLGILAGSRPAPALFEILSRFAEGELETRAV